MEAAMSSLWKAHYQLGMPQIDQQHKQLILELEDLLKALGEPGCDLKKRCQHTMDFTKDFTKVHFGAEEMYQLRIGYAGYEAHKKKHEGFADTLHQLELKLIREDYTPKAVREFADELTRWWIFHIMNEDKKYAQSPVAPG
jgi:hemerythrin